MMEVKPCGIGVTRFPCNPQIKVADSCIQLLYDGLILHERLLASQMNAFHKKRQGKFDLNKSLNSTYLSHCPFMHYFTYTTDPAELFQIIRLNYGGVHIQIVAHRVMATWKFTSTNTVCESDVNWNTSKVLLLPAGKKYNLHPAISSNRPAMDWQLVLGVPRHLP